MNTRTVTISFDPTKLDRSTSEDAVAARIQRRADTHSGLPRYNYPISLEDIEVLLMHAILARPTSSTIRSLDSFGIKVTFTETTNIAE